MSSEAESEWSEEDLEQTLYKGDEHAVNIHEIKIVDVGDPEKGFLSRLWRWNVKSSNAKEAGAENEGIDEEEEEEEEKDLIRTYLNIDLTDETEDVAHVVLFYAEWCPHCQRYKPEYISLEAEINRRTIHTKVIFHAVSCTLNEMVCRTYEIDAYPVALGWRAASKYTDIKVAGVVLNDIEMTADSIADALEFDIAEEGIVFDEPEEPYENAEDQKAYERDKIQWGIDASLEKVERYEFLHDINERYHNSAASLTYILKTGVYASTGKGGLNQEQKSALKDFLNLLYWATPQQWNVRAVMIKDLLEQFEDVVGGRDAMFRIIEKHQGAPLKKGRRREELLWGYVDETLRDNGISGTSDAKARREVKGLGGESPHRYYIEKKFIVKENSSYTRSCTHGTSIPYSGYTCGLWNLFHIITVGSGKNRNQLFGFHHGYIVSSKEVAFVIRNFIANFFRCEVCREHFLQMYDDCGHSHCQRLDERLPFARDEWLGLSVLPEIPDNESSSETAVWLWEVHNDVNLRLMNEAAERDRREISKEEILASKFPTKRLCPKCWLDEDMETFDFDEVAKFLSTWYWPEGNHEYASNINSLDVHRADSSEGTTLSSLGLYMVTIPIILVLLMMSRGAMNTMRKASGNAKKE